MGEPWASRTSSIDLLAHLSFEKCNLDIHPGKVVIAGLDRCGPDAVVGSLAITVGSIAIALGSIALAEGSIAVGSIAIAVGKMAIAVGSIAIAVGSHP